jgi:hypothetical protein
MLVISDMQTYLSCAVQDRELVLGKPAALYHVCEKVQITNGYEYVTDKNY